MRILKAKKWLGAILLIVTITVFGTELTVFGTESSQTIRIVRPLEAEEAENFTEPPEVYEDENGAVYDLADSKLDWLPGSRVSQEISRQVVYRAVEGAQSLPSSIPVREERTDGAQDSGSQSSVSQDSTPRDSGPRDSNFHVSGSQGSELQGSGSQGNELQGSGSQGNELQGSGSQNSNSQDSNSQDSNSQDSNSQDSNSQDSNSQDSNSQDSGSHVSVSQASSPWNSVPQASGSQDSSFRVSNSRDNAPQEGSGTLYATATQILGETWSDDFQVPMVFHSYGAQIYELGNISMSAEGGFPPPEEYQDELLGILNLPRDGYEITQLSWNGEPYAGPDGELCREAVASGRKRLVDYQVTYEGRVSWQMPDTCRLETVYRLRPPAVETAGAAPPETLTAKTPAPEPEMSVEQGLWYWVRSGFVITVAAGLAGIAVGILILLVMWLKREQRDKQRLSKIKG